MAGMAVMQQSTVLLKLQANKVQATGSEDATEVVVPEEAVTKDVVD